MLKRTQLVLLVPLFVFVLLRAPSVFEGFWYGDEGIYAAVAKGLADGKYLYRDIWDHKPPLIIWLFYPAAVSGWELGYAILKLSNIVWGMAVLVVVNLILKEKVRSSARFIALMFLAIIFGSTILEGNSVNSEVVFVGFNILAFYFFIKERRFLIAGFLGFLSLITKVPGFMEFALLALAFCIVYFRKHGREKTLRAIVRIVVGFSAPLALMILHFVKRGTLMDVFNANVLFNVRYSLHENNFSEIMGLAVQNTQLVALSLVLVFVVCGYYFWKKRISSLTFLAITLFVAQIFSALLSGRNYGHYFIQILTGASLLLALLAHNPKSIIKKPSRRIFTTISLSFVPMLIVFFQVWRVPIFAPPRDYYPAFINGYLLGDTDARQRFWWANGAQATKTKEFAEYFNQNYLEYDTVYIYTDKPWMIALVDREITNKYVTWFHLLYRSEHMEEEVANMQRAELFVVDKDIGILERVQKELVSGFEKIGDWQNTDIYKAKRL